MHLARFSTKSLWRCCRILDRKGTRGVRWPWSKQMLPLQEPSMDAFNQHANTTTIFTPGPKMTSRRWSHACSTLQLGRKTFGIVSGGYHNGYLDSTEWIDLEEDSPTWTEGPKLPRGL